MRGAISLSPPKLEFTQIEDSANDVRTLALDAELAEMSAVHYTKYLSQDWETSQAQSTRGLAGSVSFRSSATFQLVSIWNMYHVLRILLKQGLLQCFEKVQEPKNGGSLEQSSSSDSTAIATCSMEISTLLDSVLSTVPFMIDSSDGSSPTTNDRGPRHVGAYYLLWPLHILASCPCTSAAQKKAAHQALISIGTKSGLNTAFEIARRIT